MPLWAVAAVLDLASIGLLLGGARSWTNLARVAEGRFGHTLRGSFARDSQAGTYSSSVRATHAWNRHVGADPELARARRRAQLALGTAAVLAWPAAYCTLVLVGRALTA